MATEISDTTPLIENNDNLRRRNTPGSHYEPPPGTWDDSLPYGGKVYLARKRKADPWYIKLLEVCLVIFVVLFVYYSYNYLENLQFHVTHAYAHLGFPEAQHQTGQRYLHGAGVEKHAEHAMDWFKKAADQGHAGASYNLAVGHIRGYKTGLPQGHAHKLFHHAAANGVAAARDVLENLCTRGGCDT